MTMRSGREFYDMDPVAFGAPAPEVMAIYLKFDWYRKRGELPRQEGRIPVSRSAATRGRRLS